MSNQDDPNGEQDQPESEDADADYEGTDILDVSTLPVNQWLKLVFDPPEGKHFISAYFPTDRQKIDFLESITLRPEEEVIGLLERFLIHTGTNFLAEGSFVSLMSAKRDRAAWYKVWREKIWYRRLEAHYQGDHEIPVWEGLTWVIDLLPKHPQKAIDVIDGYITAHINLLPDIFWHRLGDSIDLIRAKFIGLPGTDAERVEFLSTLGSRRFECLVERLYDAMGYETTLTQATRDGGRDVIAIREEAGRKERLLVECKLYSNTVGVEIPRALNGVRDDERANKGVVVTNSFFSDEARAFAARNPMELIDGDHLIPLLNQHLGNDWPTRIEFLVAAAEGRPIFRVRKEFLSDGVEGDETVSEENG